MATRRALTVFLAGAECPFTCLFCDLWRHTIDGPTAPGAIPHQLSVALAEAGDARADEAIKLYNASNFFDERAVPSADDPAIAAACEGFARVTIESHARLLGERAERFADSLPGRLEVALGLETIHPEVLPRLNKGMTLTHFEAAVAWCRERSIGVRAFVLVGLPWVAAAEYAEWAARSAEYAAKLGVDRVSLIPLRTGNGALDMLERNGHLEAVRLRHLEDAMSECLERAGGAIVVEADTWDADRFASCAFCSTSRIERLAAANLRQEIGPPVLCDCGT